MLAMTAPDKPNRWALAPWALPAIVWLAVIIGALLLFVGPARLGQILTHLDSGQSLPATGPLEVGTRYQLTLYCSADFVAGERQWAIKVSGQIWPPPEPGANSDPYPTRGVLTLTSESEGYWVADVDGSRWLVRSVPTDPYSVAGCL
jgi:hypothetical protein